jgi:hypothetical protein
MKKEVWTLSKDDRSFLYEELRIHRKEIEDAYYRSYHGIEYTSEGALRMRLQRLSDLMSRLDIYKPAPKIERIEYCLDKSKKRKKSQK